MFKSFFSFALALLLLASSACAELPAFARLHSALSDQNQSALSMINAYPAWDAFLAYYTAGRQPFEAVNVGVIDTLFDENHPDFPFADVVGNISGEELAQLPMFESRTSHGTHVAEILGANHRNGLGVDGMYPLTNEPYDILPNGQVLTHSRLYGVCMLGGLPELAQYRNAFDEMLRWDVKVINISMGFTLEDMKTEDRQIYDRLVKGKCETPFEDAYLDGLATIIQSYLDMGREFLIVTSAGNERIQAQATNPLAAIWRDRYPEVYDRIVVVGNTDTDGHVFSDSNFGTRVYLMAPGEAIYSTIPGSRYGEKTGTSMASPFVAGTAAMMWCLKPSATGAEIKTRLMQNAEPYMRTSKFPIGGKQMSGVEDRRLKRYGLDAEKQIKTYALLDAAAAINSMLTLDPGPAEESGWDWQAGSSARAILEARMAEINAGKLIETGVFSALSSTATWTEADLTKLIQKSSTKS